MCPYLGEGPDTESEGHLTSTGWWPPSTRFPVCGDVRIRPGVSLSTSFTKTSVAVMAFRQGGHPEATGSRLFEIQATGLSQELRVCVRTPLAMPFLSWI